MAINDEFLILKTENTTLLQAMHLFLSLDELEDLNLKLYEFTESCLANRANPELNNIVYRVKIKFRRISANRR